MFLYHYGKQLGGGTNSINVLRRDKFDYYTINFDQHQNIYNFFDGGLVHEFIKQENTIEHFKGRLKSLISKEEKLFYKINKCG